jgi:inner membrane protein
MDTLTHALSGALLGRATAPKDAPARSMPRRVAAGFFAAAAPDLDFLLGFIGPLEYLAYHRGPTHSLLLAPLWALPLAWVLAAVLREPRGWRALYGIATMALYAHIAGDVITSFGTVVLAPLSDWRAGIGTTFIIDLWFSGIIVAGLLASALFYRSRIPAMAASAVLLAYIGFQYLQRQEALDFAAQYARSRGLDAARMEAHPRPVSPFNWTVFVSTTEEHHYAHVNLRRTVPRNYQPGDGFVARLDAPYQPLALARWETRARYDGDSAREAWESPALGVFRWFADLPAFDGRSTGSSCVWFVDLRFLTPGREGMPFRHGACREAPGAPWRLAID